MHERRLETPAVTIDFRRIFRAFAGVSVFINHEYGVVPYERTDNLLNLGPLNLNVILQGSAQAGVVMFFVLSGFLIRKGFHASRYTSDRNGALLFYWNRFLRIVPLYLCYVLICVTIGGATLPTAQQT